MEATRPTASWSARHSVTAANVKLAEIYRGCYWSFGFPLLMSTTRDQLGDSPVALYRRLWPHTILSGGRLPDLQSIVKRIAYVTWNGLANYGYEPDGYTFLHGAGRWMNSGARIVEITPELIKAVLRTDIRYIQDVTDSDFRLPAVMFVMPKGTLRSAVRGDCSNLLVSISTPADMADFSQVGCRNVRPPLIWLLTTASTSYEQQSPEIICEELGLQNQAELEATLLRPVPERLIVPEGLAPLNDADFRFVSLHLGFKLIVLLNLYWSQVKPLTFVYDESGKHYRQRCPPESFWKDFNLNSRSVSSWKRGTLIFHVGQVDEYGVDADWILPSPRLDHPEEAETAAVPPPEAPKREEPMNERRRWLRYLLGAR
jgi:hypothetical protein